MSDTTDDSGICRCLLDSDRTRLYHLDSCPVAPGQRLRYAAAELIAEPGDTLERDLASATNLGGRLSDDTKARVRAAVECPGEQTWDAAYSVILNADEGAGLTLWQAVIAVDPAFPRSKTVLPGGVQCWQRFPDEETLRTAIAYATH